MIIGLFLRHYKCYHKSNYIPFITPHKRNNLNLIIGNNGSGKSSILEALDIYFNRTGTNRFILSKNEKRQESHIAPVLLLEKKFLTEVVWANKTGDISKAQLEEIANLISNFLWTLKPNPASKAQDKLRESIKGIGATASNETHYLLTDGIDSDGNHVLPIELLSKELDTKAYESKTIKAFFNSLRASIKFVYIPVETSIQSYLRLEGEGMESFMGKTVKTKIDTAFSDPIQKDGRPTTMIKYINETLDTFVAETEKSIQKIESDYSFDTDYMMKKNVTAKDLREQIILEYFRNRKLKKGKTSINDLSSGQRKKALVDIIYSLSLSTDSHNDKKVILAIDEPESSLHVSNCYDQFEKIQKIALSGFQSFITTHWYGSIPVLESGTINHVLEVQNEPPDISVFDSSNVYDNHGAHRVEDIDFKSVYDLASSLLSMLRHGNKHWIIVEGVSDKYYLESYFDPEKVKILSIGGIDRLIDVAEFLSIPLSKNDEKKGIQNKILFLSDNDKEYKPAVQRTASKLLFQRYTFDKGRVVLSDYSERKHGDVLTVEEVMNSDVMWRALNLLATDVPELKDALQEFELESDFNLSRFSGDYSFLKTPKTGKEKVELYENLRKVLSPLKTRLAIVYKSLSDDEKIEWIEEVKALLK